MSKKVGRNEQCPCGSGKKYKKCCLQNKTKAKLNDIPKSNNTVNNNVNIKLGLNIRPYVIAKICEPNSDEVQELLKKRPELHSKIKKSFYPSKVRTFSTVKIISMLSERGVQYNQEQFIKICKQHDSAWDVAYSLWPEQSHSASMDIADFIGISSCILWERLYLEGCLSKVSYEMLDDWMQDGYDYLPEKPIEASKVWIKTWDAFKRLFDLNKMTIASIDNKFNGSQSFSNWCQAFEIEIYNVAIEDKNFIDEGIKYLTEFIDYFSEDDPQILENAKNTLVDLQNII